MSNKVEINEILIHPLLGFRLSGGSNENYENLIEIIENTEEIDSIPLVYQGHIGFTISAEGERLKEILIELNKYIEYESEEDIISALNNLFNFSKGILNGFND